MEECMHLTWIVFFTCCFLTSCGGNWVSKTKSPSALDGDTAACESHARNQCPPKTYFKHMPSYESMATSYNGRSGIAVMHVEEFSVQEVDANKNARDQAFKDCMINKGWHQE